MVTQFYVNVDEATSSSGKFVFTILVSFFNINIPGEVRCSSLQFNRVSKDVHAQTIANKTLALFKQNNISLEYPISMLGDSAVYMRGKCSGVETRIRESAYHLLDIDGGMCHKFQKLTSIWNIYGVTSTTT